MREILFRGKPIVEEELMEPNETLKEFFKRQHDWSDYGVDEAFTDDGFVIGQVVYDGKKAWIVGEVVEAGEDYIALEYWVPVKPETVGQYTGLKDKNGVKIFEGDIVKAWSEGVKAVGVIKQRIDGIWLMYPAWQDGQSWGLCPTRDGKTTVEAIGNIHDNPELLEEVE